VINNRFSKKWQAKYHLVGHNCQVWAWGNNSTTYSYNINTPDQATAQTYFEKKITRNCLSDDWQMSEQKRRKIKG